MARSEDDGAEVRGRLGYLLKHAQIRLTELYEAALEPFGLTPRELPVLVVLAGREPASQQEVAQALGIDRTSMVALLDALERKGVVVRHPHADDRRRNVVELTEPGQDVLRRASAAAEAAERTFLAPLDAADVRRLTGILHAVVHVGGGG